MAGSKQFTPVIASAPRGGANPDPDDNSTAILVGYILCALSGGIMGIPVGIFIGWVIWK